MTGPLVIIGVASFITAFNVTFAVLTWRRTRESRRAAADYPYSRSGTSSSLGAIEPEPDQGTVTDEPRPDPRVVLEPVKAWKFQHVTRRADGTVIIFGHGGHTYGVEAVARCEAHQYSADRNPRSHTAPDEKCTCGFYGLKEKPTRVMPGQCLLEVEMYGKVIPHELGYRAEKMRVLSITASPNCEGRDLNTPQVGVYPGHMMHTLVSPYSGTCGLPPRFITNEGALYCAQHAISAGVRFHEWSREPVDCETEWRWA